MENQPPAPTADNQPKNQYNSDFINSSQDNVFTSSDHNQKVTSVKLKKSSGSIFIFFSVLTLLLAMAGLGYFFWTNNNLGKQLVDLTSQKTSLKKEYNNAQNQKIISKSDQLINRASLLDQMINKRINWKKVLDIINIESYRNVKYTSIALGDDKTLTLAGETPDENNFAKMYRAWEQSEYIDSVAPGTFQRTESDEENSNESLITFSISINLNDKIFNTEVATPVAPSN